MNKDQIPDLSEFTHLKKFNEKKDKYILDKDKNVIPATLLEWAEFLETTNNERIVKKDTIGKHHISTVFIGLDHNDCVGKEKVNKPSIFETMVFNEDGCEDYCVRYSTWKEAEEGHQIAVEWIKMGCRDEP